MNKTHGEPFCPNDPYPQILDFIRPIVLGTSCHFPESCFPVLAAAQNLKHYHGKSCS
jgi:hypothetical protein